MRILHKLRSTDPLKEAAIAALERVVDPLVDLMFDTGITVQEFSRLVRDRAVRSASARVARESGRESNSRVAIATGLARAEVARILATDELSFSARIGQHPARRVLGAWYDNQRFLDSNGDPAALPIFGKRKSFEQLVALHGGGIPVRAMLDQLNQFGAVEVLSAQRVRVKTRIPIFRGMTVSAIANVGERAGDLLGTLKTNLHTTSTPLFESTALVSDIESGMVPLVRKQMAEQGVAFIDSASSLLSRSRKKLSRSVTKDSSLCRVGVTVYYFENGISQSALGSSSDYKRRKNLQRRFDKANSRRR